MSHILWIAAGAVLGANARYLVALWATSRLGGDFPYGTLIVNASGSFLVGFLLTLAAARFAVPLELRLFLIVGFLGSYTTFSTYAIESILLLQHGSIWGSLLNIFGTNLLCLLCVLLGILLSRQLS
jgi:fluoride exporter